MTPPITKQNHLMLTNLSKRNANWQAWSDTLLAPEHWSRQQAWLLSVIAHTAILVAMVLLWHPRIRGTGGDSDIPPGLAFVQEGLTDNQFSLAGDDSGEDASIEGGSTADTGNAANAGSAPVSIQDLLQDLTGTANGSELPATGSGVGGSGLSGLGKHGDGDGGGGPGGKGKTRFMGVDGSGASFVYILDHSESMNQFEGAPLRFAKKELLNSINSLKERHQFQIVFYNETARAFRPNRESGSMLFANENNKLLASDFIRSVIGIGGTEHIPGLKLGLSFSPDVVFFLTDAAEPAMSETQLLEIQMRAERALTTIHTIQFNAGPAENEGGWIRQLAEMNRGKYRYVDITSLE